ncbi:hypothetical protein ABPG77_006334 [Micractinium sp. CCAP 211/92]
MQGKPGDDEFLRRRLERAAALPPEQRSAEVTAFLDAAQLPEQVASLLPLQPDGTPALPLHSTDTRQRVLLAGLKYFQVHTQCPQHVVGLFGTSQETLFVYDSTLAGLPAGKAAQDCVDNSVRFCWPAGLQAARRLAAVRGLLAAQRSPRYGSNAECWARDAGTTPRSDNAGNSTTSEPSNASAGRSCSTLEPTSGDICLAELLLQLVDSLHPPADGNYSQQFSCAKAVADFLAAADCFASLHLSLQRLQEVQARLLPGASPLPSVAQLRCACWEVALQVARSRGVTWTRSGVAAGEVRQWAQDMFPLLESTLEKALRLHPDSLKLRFLASEALAVLHEPKHSLHQMLRCIQLAQQQGSKYFLAIAAASAMATARTQLYKVAALGGSLDIGLDQAEAALAAFSQAEPALKRCKRVLPQYWTAEAERCCFVFQHTLSDSWACLHLLQPGGNSSCGRSRQPQAAQAHVRAQGGQPDATQGPNAACFGSA